MADLDRVSDAISTSGLRACPACHHVGGPGRRFCGRCRAVLVRPCSGCGFGNELDDAWCGGCARALAPRADRPASVEAHAAIPPRPRPVVGPVIIPPAPPASEGLSAMLLAINRSGAAGPGAAAGGVDVHDQDQLDALFGDQP